MNVLLMAMPDVHPYFKPWKIMGPSLSLASLAGNLDPRHGVHIADLVARRRDVKRAVVEAVRRTAPRIVGLSAMTFQFDTARRIAGLIKAIDPTVLVALGGYHATVMFEDIASSKDGKDFDFLVRQEGDLAFNELVDAIEGKKGFEAIRGLSFRVGKDLVHNPARSIEDLSRIKLPRRTVRLWQGFHAMGRPFDVIETSRGCLMSCSFCSIRKMYGRSYRAYPVERIIADIESARAAGARTLFFADDNVTLDTQRFEVICDAIVESGNSDLHFSAQVSSLGIASSESLAEKMRRAGFTTVFVGIENVSQRNLKYLHKGNIVEKTRLALERLRAQKIVMIGGLIVGNPEDTAEDIEENYRFLGAHGVDTGLDQVVTPYLGTELRESLREEGLITNTDDYRFYNGHFVNVRTKHLSRDELAFIRWRCKERYVNSSESAGTTTTNLIRHYPGFVLRFLVPCAGKAIAKRAMRRLMGDRWVFEREQRKDVALNVFNV